MNYAARRSYSNYKNQPTRSNETHHLPSLPTQSSLAPLVAFDEDGDIPIPVIERLDVVISPSTAHSNLIVNYCCHCCSWQKFRNDFCHIFSHFFFSQLGLSVLVFIYVALGGFIFYAIESKHELRKNEQIKLEYSRGIRNIRFIATNEFNWMLNASFELRYALWRGMMSRQDGYDNTGWRVYVNSERFDKLIDDELARMQAEQEKLSDKHDSRTEAAYNQKWTFSTAMLYSATVITTVGYGHIAPKSILGKVMTCIYAMFGIPIMIMCLTNTGDLLAFFFIKYYSLTIHFTQRLLKSRRAKLYHQNQTEYVEHVPIAATLGVLALYIIAGAVLFSHWEGWSYVDGAYFSFITFTTIGLGDLVPGKGTLTENKNGKSILCALYLLFGLVLTAMCFKLMQDDLFAIKRKLFARLGLESQHNVHHHHQSHERELIKHNNCMAERRILILDDGQITSIIAEHSWTDFLDDSDGNVELYIFTTYKEVPHPTSDGALELWAFHMHRQYTFTHIYTKNEDLIIRAAHLRTLLNIKTGLSADQVQAYREKVHMKELATVGGFPVPPFTRLLAPIDLICFIEKYGYPVIVKPTLGCAVAGLHLISNEEELQSFLSSKLFSCIDINQRMDLVGELMVEGFMRGRMYHVNGIAVNGRITHVWPFAYLHTCLDFAKHGTAYGNSSVPRSNPLFNRLYNAAQRLLDILPTPNDCLIFHLELYENLDEKRSPNDDFVLCEIAARAPGGSITHLIDLLSFQDNEYDSFARLDFRASVSLPIPLSSTEHEQDDKVITDLVIPRKSGKLMYIPRECPLPNLTYIPLANVEKPTTYDKYDANSINSACRLITYSKTMDEGRELVEKGLKWFDDACIVTPIDEPCSVSLIKEFHRFLSRRTFNVI
ncbi:unnamed protein product [Adineta ricciae]|uniref:ATP-grasp domain-containing protein n=1 Tax=Adineta ricciae TaxID=249248 RepID=A0A813P0X2_ADIRI|nr:unnamed protein product [Adineta ricciae]